jgi:hypothetical protein
VLYRRGRQSMVSEGLHAGRYRLRASLGRGTAFNSHDRSMA